MALDKVTQMEDNPSMRYDKTLTIRLSHEQLRQLEKGEKERKATKGEIVRAALRRFLK